MTTQYARWLDDSGMARREEIGYRSQMWWLSSAHQLGSAQGRKRAEVVWAAAYILIGLRYSAVLAAQLFAVVMSMKESSTYQAILAEGRTEGAVLEAQKVLRMQGEDAFGPPDRRTAAAIERLQNLAQLEELLRRVRTAQSWQELLGLTAPGRRSGRRRPSP